MARRVFFSFHYTRDIWRAKQVRMANVVAGADHAGFFDHSEYLESKKKGDKAIERMIHQGVPGPHQDPGQRGQSTDECLDQAWILGHPEVSSMCAQPSSQTVGHFVVDTEVIR
jgi:hypothetical protein